MLRGLKNTNVCYNEKLEGVHANISTVLESMGRCEDGYVLWNERLSV